jgi:hypothetical protein
MSKQKLVTFTELVKEDISRKGLEDQTLPLDYTDPEALEVEFEIDLRLKDSEGNLWAEIISEPPPRSAQVSLK